jgi:hypothetical protein
VARSAGGRGSAEGHRITVFSEAAVHASTGQARWATLMAVNCSFTDQRMAAYDKGPGQVPGCMQRFLDALGGRCRCAASRTAARSGASVILTGSARPQADVLFDKENLPALRDKPLDVRVPVRRTGLGVLNLLRYSSSDLISFELSSE